jgi:hypothetical protein
MEEAESAAKLTELTFVFILLCFAARIFSMSINGLKDGVPLSYFIGTAIGPICFAYSVHLASRSAGLLIYKRQCFAHMRELGKLSESDPVTTRTFLS